MNADELKQQIRRCVFARDFARGEAATSRLASFFVVCSVCHGRGTEQRFVRYDDQEVCERGICQRCDGAGFVAVTAEESEHQNHEPGQNSSY